MAVLAMLPVVMQAIPLLLVLLGVEKTQPPALKKLKQLLPKRPMSSAAQLF